MQFTPLVVLPQLLLCGLLRSRDSLAGGLHAISDVMPLSYAVDALQRVAVGTTLGGLYWRDVAILTACVLAGLCLAAATLRRRTP